MISMFLNATSGRVEKAPKELPIMVGSNLGISNGNKVKVDSNKITPGEISGSYYKQLLIEARGLAEHINPKLLGLDNRGSETKKVGYFEFFNAGDESPIVSFKILYDFFNNLFSGSINDNKIKNEKSKKLAENVIKLMKEIYDKYNIGGVGIKLNNEAITGDDIFSLHYIIADVISLLASNGDGDFAHNLQFAFAKINESINSMDTGSDINIDLSKRKLHIGSESYDITGQIYSVTADGKTHSNDYGLDKMFEVPLDATKPNVNKKDNKVVVVEQKKFEQKVIKNDEKQVKQDVVDLKKDVEDILPKVKQRVEMIENDLKETAKDLKKTAKDIIIQAADDVKASLETPNAVNVNTSNAASVNTSNAASINTPNAADINTSSTESIVITPAAVVESNSKSSDQSDVKVVVEENKKDDNSNVKVIAGAGLGFGGAAVIVGIGAKNGNSNQDSSLNVNTTATNTTNTADDLSEADKEPGEKGNLSSANNNDLDTEDTEASETGETGGTSETGGTGDE